jgi:hypothetical protein
LNVYGFNDVRQREIHCSRTTMPQPIAFEVERAIEKLKNLNHEELI